MFRRRRSGQIYFWLSDGAWTAIEPHLPHGKPGKPRVDDRTVNSGILHVIKSAYRLCGVPDAYGRPTTIYNHITVHENGVGPNTLSIRSNGTQAKKRH